MRILYNIVIYTYTGIIHLVALFNNKASLWVKGRKEWYKKLDEAISPGTGIVWVHCASLGEFEQGRPVIESIKARNPETRIVLTFFSPSGYEIRKNYPLADYTCYLPADTPSNARKFVKRLNPEYVIFIKYEYWNNYISELYKKEIPTYLVSAIFRKKQIFFRWYAKFFRNLLKKFTHVFVQNSESSELLKGIGLSEVTLAGDTRFDRVLQIAAAAKDLPIIEKFRGNEKLFLAGSSWKTDEEIIARYINKYPLTMKWLFAPHEVDRPNIDRLEKMFNGSAVRYSEIEKGSGEKRVLILDNIGMLSSVYRYAYVAAIGGGFGKGIHNILEPASWGIPVVFGPNHENFNEAKDLIAGGGARTFSNYPEFEQCINHWVSDEQMYKADASTARTYVIRNAGATKIITERILQ